MKFLDSLFRINQMATSLHEKIVVYLHLKYKKDWECTFLFEIVRILLDKIELREYFTFI